MNFNAPFRRGLACVLLGAILAACSTASVPTPSVGPCPSAAPTADQAATINAGAARAVVTTNLGSFTIELYPQVAPIAAANFVVLARCGFYDGISFHRVIAGFVAQAGDPGTKSNRGAFVGLGRGGPGYTFAIEPPATGYGYDQYVVAMANNGRPDSNDSQFFIDLVDLNQGLDRAYTIFGRVVDGTAVIDTIGTAATTPDDLPIEPIIINSVTIESAD